MREKLRSRLRLDPRFLPFQRGVPRGYQELIPRKYFRYRTRCHTYCHKAEQSPRQLLDLACASHEEMQA